MERQAKRWLLWFTAVLLLASFGDGVLARKKGNRQVNFARVVRANLWFQSTGLLRYGVGASEIEAVVKNAVVCGDRYQVREIPWPLKNQVPPAQGPFWGVFLSGNGVGENLTDPVLVLIGEGAQVQYAAQPVMGGDSYQWYHLPGHPQLKTGVEKEQQPEQEAHAQKYWPLQRRLKSFLSTPHSEEEVLLLLRELAQGEGRRMIVMAETGRPETLLREDTPPVQALLACDFEPKIAWDRTYAIGLAVSPYWKPEASSLDLLANVYCRQGVVTGIVWRQWNVEGVCPDAIVRSKSCGWLPTNTIEYWVPNTKKVPPLT